MSGTYGGGWRPPVFYTRGTSPAVEPATVYVSLGPGESRSRNRTVMPETFAALPPSPRRTGAGTGFATPAYPRGDPADYQSDSPFERQVSSPSSRGQGPNYSSLDCERYHYPSPQQLERNINGYERETRARDPEPNRMVHQDIMAGRRFSDVRNRPDFGRAVRDANATLQRELERPCLQGPSRQRDRMGAPEQLAQSRRETAYRAFVETVSSAAINARNSSVSFPRESWQPSRQSALPPREVTLPRVWLEERESYGPGMWEPDNQRPTTDRFAGDPASLGRTLYHRRHGGGRRD